MVEDLDERQPLTCLIDQDLVDKVFVLVGKTRLESNLTSHNLIADLSRVHSSKRSPAMHQFIQQDTK